ncbi:RING finger protein 227 [Heteronotia binoei]|uniref:RING finger protein 227 n=1 Tax=Heteronotia binoei TaxID=13085 RepID=UPI00292CB840|nr:RING finger protein 227 [Heteronotia binoei]
MGQLEAGGAEELECGICCQPYDCCGRAPRRLGNARGSWKPSQCRHVLCSACACRLAREGGWDEVTCPYCRTVTPLRERGNFLAAGVRRSSGYGRRRLVLPPIDTELWQRVVLAERERQEAAWLAGEAPGEEDDGEAEDEAGQWRLWRALKRILKGGAGRTAHAPRRSRSVPARRSQPINPDVSDMKDLTVMSCYVI